MQNRIDGSSRTFLQAKFPGQCAKKDLQPKPRCWAARWFLLAMFTAVVVLNGVAHAHRNGQTQRRTQTTMSEKTEVEFDAQLPEDQQKKVNQAIERGLTYLRRAHQGNGSFGNAVAAQRPWPVGFAALVGLTLIESGVDSKEEIVQDAARFVRKEAPTLNRTYEIALAILFLERMRSVSDSPTIRSLALRLAAGQGAFGAWTYTCPVLQPAQEQQWLEHLSKQRRVQDPKKLLQGTVQDENHGDHSNTQFAVLGLWVAKRHDLPVESALVRAEQRFRFSQLTGGWGYSLRKGNRERPYGSMTCVGLLALAAGAGARETPADGDAARGKSDDGGLTRGLLALAGYLDDPADNGIPVSAQSWGPKGTPNLYFLWSVERVGVLCNLKTIGGRDWYSWGVDLLVPLQRKDGSWVGRGSGGQSVIDTCFALLFLKRSDLLPDLRETLQKRLTITDPISQPKSPGEKRELEKGIEKKSPGEKPTSKAPAGAAMLTMANGARTVGAKEPALPATGATLNLFPGSIFNSAPGIPLTVKGTVNMFAATITGAVDVSGGLPGSTTPPAYGVVNSLSSAWNRRTCTTRLLDDVRGPRGHVRRLFVEQPV